MAVTTASAKSDTKTAITAAQLHHPLPNGVTKIDFDAFYGCSRLTSVSIPDSVSSIEIYAFEGCSSLTDVYYSGSAAQWNQIDIDNYHWGVDMYGNQGAYSVSTSSWAFAPGEETRISPAEMQHSVWVLDGTSFLYIGDAEMSYTPDSITWTFTVPEEYPFNFANVNRYEVFVTDISLDLSFKRVYTLN